MTFFDMIEGLAVWIMFLLWVCVLVLLPTAAAIYFLVYLFGAW